MSDVGFKTDLLERPLNDVKLMDFFGSVQQTAPLGATRSIDGIDDRSKRHLHQQQHTEAELQLATGQTYATKVGVLSDLFLCTRMRIIVLSLKLQQLRHAMHVTL